MVLTAFCLQALTIAGLALLLFAGYYVYRTYTGDERSRTLLLLLLCFVWRDAVLVRVTHCSVETVATNITYTRVGRRPGTVG